MSFTAEQRRVATLLGINNIDSQNDINQINRALSGSKAAGVNRIDSANDLRMIEDYYSQGSSSQDYFSDPNSELGQQDKYYQDMLEKLKILLLQMLTLLQKDLT